MIGQSSESEVRIDDINISWVGGGEGINDDFCTKGD